MLRFQSEVTYIDSFSLPVCVCCVHYASVLYNAYVIACIQIVCLALDSNYQWLHHNDTARAETDKIVASPEK